MGRFGCAERSRRRDLSKVEEGPTVTSVTLNGRHIHSFPSSSFSLILIRVDMSTIEAALDSRSNLSSTTQFLFSLLLFHLHIIRTVSHLSQQKILQLFSL